MITHRPTAPDGLRRVPDAPAEALTLAALAEELDHAATALMLAENMTAIAHRVLVENAITVIVRGLVNGEGASMLNAALDRVGRAYTFEATAGQRAEQASAAADQLLPEAP